MSFADQVAGGWVGCLLEQWSGRQQLRPKVYSLLSSIFNTVFFVESLLVFVVERRFKVETRRGFVFVISTRPDVSYGTAHHYGTVLAYSVCPFVLLGYQAPYE